jgi:hypothetical protein
MAAFTQEEMVEMSTRLLSTALGMLLHYGVRVTVMVLA